LVAIGCSNSIEPSGGGGSGNSNMAGSGSGLAGAPAGAGSPGTSGGNPGSGGAPMGGAGGAIDQGGAPGMAGMPASAGAGGSAPTAGGGGAAGSGQAGMGTGGGSGGAPATISIDSTDFGAFNNSFMITPCGDAGNGYDCLNNPATGTCKTSNWSYDGNQTTEAEGNTYSEVFKVTGGDPNKVYSVTIKVLGHVEGRTYTSGKRNSTTNADPTMTGDLLYIGGKPGTGRPDYNAYQMTITGGTPIAGEPTYFAFNSVDTGHEGEHHNYSIDETLTFKVKSGMTITLTNHDSNCRAIMNCGLQATPYGFTTAKACTDLATATPASVTLPATFRNVAIMNPGKFQTQFVNIKVTSIVAN